MVLHLKEVIGAGGELSVDERSLLAIAYSRMVCTRRSSLRTILSIEQKKQPRVNEEHIATTRGYRKKIENELETICSDVLDLLDGSLIPNAGTVDSKVLYYKMYAYFTGLHFLKALGLTHSVFRKGDYSRYLAEFTSGEKHTAAVSSAYNAYKVGSKSVARL
jgi:14-3-3 protein epsilon